MRQVLVDKLNETIPKEDYISAVYIGYRIPSIGNGKNEGYNY